MAQRKYFGVYFGNPDFPTWVTIREAIMVAFAGLGVLTFGGLIVCWLVTRAGELASKIG